MTTLDHRLYAWLLESNERRFELGFKAYFDVAYPSVIRYLARLSRWDPVHLEELAQDALLRFFDKVGRNRREASEAVGASMAQIRPLNFGAFHERKVNSWINDIGSFKESAMGFRLPQSENTEWKSSVRALAERIPVMRNEGCRLLHSVHLELRWTFADLDLRPTAAMDPKAGQFDGDDLIPGNGEANANCEERLVEEMLTQTARAAIAEQDHPGATLFVQGTWTIVRALPSLRVPTNGYLFEIAGTIYLDECKKRGRQKRGGTGALIASPAEGVGNDFSNHPIERIALELFAADEGDGQFDDAAPAKAGNNVGGFTVPSVDPTSQYENEDLFEKFYEYLRRPVDDAVDAFNEAQKVRRAIAERRKLDSLTDKFSRTMSVLSIMGEGYTQDQTAERLGLSRNQVKYILEVVQESYARFTADTHRQANRAPAVSGEPHVV